MPMATVIAPMPSQLQLVTSNRMENLAIGLAELLRTPPESGTHHPLRPETVMVQSKGMQRWISMTLARLNGICANVDFPFPNAFLDRLYGLIVGPMPEFDPYDPNALSFRIYNVLPTLLRLPEFESLRVYLSDRKTPLKQYQLACKLADMFDQYAVFRTDMLMGWETGAPGGQPPEGFAWQALLWRRVVSDTRTPHRTTLHLELISRLRRSAAHAVIERLPARLMLFGISHLPPFHLQALEALAQRIPVYIFLLNPCRHYWFDIVSDHQIILRRSGHESHGGAAQLHLERGNRLLASLGFLGQQFFERVHQSDAQVIEAFDEQPGDTLLSRIQGDIFELVDRQPPDKRPEESSVMADGSLRIHSCHGPMREVEVLYDQLLDMLANDETLAPRDILVMAPNINLYAPYIQAVFGAAQGEQNPIPFSVTDQSLLMQNPAAETFVQLLDLVGGRFEASRVLALVQFPAIGEKFGISAADLPIVEHWISAVSIRWGWDANERRRQGLPGYQENTWRTGLDRLIMGYAFAPEHGGLFAGILPYDGIGAGQGRIVGSLAAFAEAVHKSIIEMEGSDSLAGWHDRLKRLVDRFFIKSYEKEPELRALRSTLDRLERIGRVTADPTPLPFDVVRVMVKDSLGQATHDVGFMAGGITFCAMLPMRSIPARVICLLGMNHDAYPRDQRLPGFNLIGVEPRRGDRSKRHDDRYLFLETLISTRKILYISYVGQNIQDNAPIPPSVVVDELLEYATEGFGILADHLVTRHPLHGFSPAYFNGSHSHLFSYSEENKKAAQLLAAEANERSFFKRPLPTMEAHRKYCEWGQLCAFFAHPARYLLEQRLGIQINARAHIIEDRENFALDALDRYWINHRILKALMAEKSADETYAVIKAAGMLPHGTAGKMLHTKLAAEVAEYLRTMNTFLPKEKPRSAIVQVSLPPFEVDGSLSDLYAAARIVCRLANVRPKDLLDSFIYHLALGLAPVGNIPKSTILICKDSIWRFGPVASPESVLRDYLMFYWQGLQKPLPLLCRTSLEYARQRIINGHPPETAMGLAAKIWRGNEFAPGEASDPYYKRCFGGEPPLGPEFEEIAMKVFGPLLIAGEQMPVG
jgi:exodeoxyribonuclease V gamma subunit